jgi:hypothetical protein
MPHTPCAYTRRKLEGQLKKKRDFETFFPKPAAHSFTGLINGVICGSGSRTFEDPPMRGVRYLDKLIDEET